LILFIKIDSKARFGNPPSQQNALGLEPAMAEEANGLGAGDQPDQSIRSRERMPARRRSAGPGIMSETQWPPAIARP